ncbi:MAG: hypothetical protein ACPL3C_09175 [Pyrobaculum sp.]
MVCVRLDSETAERIREHADRHFGGNVSESLRHAAELLLSQPPEPPKLQPSAVVDEETGMEMLQGRA